MKTARWVPMLVLAVLAQGERHGYGIVQHIREHSDDAIVVNEGLLYPLLHEMERDGLITSRWARPEAGRARKYYRLAEGGTRRLREEQTAWQHEVRAIEGILGGTV